MNYQQELDSQELAWRLIKDNPYKAMEVLDYDEDGVRELFGALNEALDEATEGDIDQLINW